MRLLVTTPVTVLVDVPDVRHVRAEDETGAFGIQPGHADFVTVLTVSVVTYRDGEGREHFVAVSGGVLTVQDGNLVEIATRAAAGEDTLRELGPAVLERFRSESETEEESRQSSTQLHLATIRKLQRYLESSRLPASNLPTGLYDGQAGEEGGA